MLLPNAKENYRKKTQTRLRRIRTRISILEKQAGEAEADIKVRDDQKIEQIRGQYANAKDKLMELGKTRQDTWFEQKAEIDRAIDNLSEITESMARQFSA